MTEKYFTRRVIFSHIPKTGGQYIHELIGLGVDSRVINKSGPSDAIVHFGETRQLYLNNSLFTF